MIETVFMTKLSKKANVYEPQPGSEMHMTLSLVV